MGLPCVVVLELLPVHPREPGIRCEVQVQPQAFPGGVNTPGDIVTTGTNAHPQFLILLLTLTKLKR